MRKKQTKLVLLVEDDPDIATLYSTLLTAEGMAVEVCTNCRQARDWWEAARRAPDLLVVDVRLPDGNGLDLCRTIVASPNGARRPALLVLSAHGDPRLPTACQKAGGIFMDKLNEQDQFMVKVRQLLADSQAPA